jgi:hypothetical protein
MDVKMIIELRVENEHEMGKLADAIHECVQATTDYYEMDWEEVTRLNPYESKLEDGAEPS